MWAAGCAITGRGAESPRRHCGFGSSYAALQLIFPNHLRGQVSALFLFTLSLGGLSLGPLVPGLLTDYLFRNDKMIASSLALTIAVASVLMWALFLTTYRPYREDYLAAQRAGAR